MYHLKVELGFVIPGPEKNKDRHCLKFIALPVLTSTSRSFVYVHWYISFILGEQLGIAHIITQKLLNELTGFIERSLSL